MSLDVEIKGLFLQPNDFYDINYILPLTFNLYDDKIQNIGYVLI